MPDDRLTEFIARWFTRAKKEDNTFDRFFSLWICLVVATKRERIESGGGGENDTDRKRVVWYFKRHSNAVVLALGGCSTEARWLADRRGAIRRDPILDNSPDDARGVDAKLAALQRYLAGRGPRVHETHAVECTAELLNKVRNNVFHGVKVYDDHDDVELLRRINPLLTEILTRAEPALASIE